MFIYVINIKRTLKILKRLVALLLIISIAIFGARLIEAKYVYANSDQINIGQVIIIDAGHGGEDPGAIGINGKYEKDLNLQIALVIGEELKSRGYTVVYTRTQDKMLYLPEENIKGMRKISDLKNRCKLTEEYENGILVSIHMNSYGASKYSGLQVYYMDGNEESALLATKIQQSVKNSLQPNNKRQIKSGKDMYILEHSNLNAVLIECGFLTNAEECEKLSQKEYQKELSFAVACGIIEYIEKQN